MLTATIIQTIVFISYITFILIKFKQILPSISESWYRLRDLGGVWYSLFTWFCWGLAFSMPFQTNDIAPYLFILSGAGLGLVGAAAMFREINDKLQGKLHTIGAVVGIIGALTGIWVERGTFIPFAVFAASALLLSLFKVKNKTWWIEMSAFVSILYGLYFF
jgi:hypothetical protein